MDVGFVKSWHYVKTNYVEDSHSGGDIWSAIFSNIFSSPLKQQPSDICGICGGRHVTQVCIILANANVEERVQRLAAKGSHSEELYRAAKV